ncbi:hypothetical protein BDV36DRAFT_265055 [Aspergillus pseudocaelatus]|uniref:Uncharacterized protein n=1 Tax=Aspergillus pseudocaelatus TaxID=1825620 RepID=A0ABQ6WBI5_9EURO|nr:hypothetical protein BDV36DRAFT_265055 [Aspergillus pseudocaelatus]
MLKMPLAKPQRKSLHLKTMLFGSMSLRVQIRTRCLKRLQHKPGNAGISLPQPVRP